MTLKTAGSDSVTATDTVTSTITGSASTTVSAAVASVFAMSGASTAMAGTGFNVTVTAKDAYGNTATGYTGTMKFTSTDRHAALPANYTFTSANDGVATLTVTLKTAGSQSVAAADTRTGSITGGASTTVSPAAASVFAVSGATAETAGTGFNVTVTAKDAYGNTATGYTGTVKLTSSDGQAVLPANYTFTSTDAGTHVFRVTLKTAGAQSVTATDTSTGTITGSNSTTISAAAASVFLLSAPFTATGGTAFNVTLTVEDAYGNVVTGYTGTVEFTSTDGKAILPADYTFTTANDGVKTFSVTLETVGSDSITATDTTTTTIHASAAVAVS